MDYYMYMDVLDIVALFAKKGEEKRRSMPTPLTMTLSYSNFSVTPLFLLKIKFILTIISYFQNLVLL